MAIFLTESSRILVQGITGSEGTKHARRMVASGANIVAGVTPGKGGVEVDAGNGVTVPVYGSVGEAVKATGADVSVVFVPPRFAKAAVLETIDAGVPLCVVITEGIPVRDTAEFFQHAVDTGTTRLIGPNCPGLISPGRSNAGIIPGTISGPGRIGLVSKSGTLTYQMMYELRDLGFSTAVGIGGDPINGLKHLDIMKLFNDDPGTDAVVMIGEIGGSDEADAARWCKEHMKKPIVGFIAGVTAPPGKRMGHAGALISGGADTADAKLAVMEECGFAVTRNPSEMGRLMKSLL